MLRKGDEMKRQLQTDLLGTRVVIGPESGTQSGPFSDSAGKKGKIRTVYYDHDGELKYSIQVIETGKLHEFYPCHFTIEG